MAHNESYKVGDSDQSFVSYPLIITHALTYTGTDLPVTVPVPKGMALIGVGNIIDTAFASATVVAIGIAGSTAHWLTETNVAATAVGKMVTSFGYATAGMLGNTPFESAAGSVVVSTGSTTNTTVGNGRLYLFMFDVSGNWRDATPGY